MNEYVWSYDRRRFEPRGDSPHVRLSLGSTIKREFRQQFWVVNEKLIMVNFLGFIAWILIFLVSSVYSNCPSQIFPNTSYHECDDLPTINSRLYWLFDPSISSLSIAFTAPPAEPEGWIAWGINPISTGMLGAQVLVAFRQPIGSITVKTFHLTSYTILVEAPIDFEVWQMSAEESTALGFITIFVTLRTPENIQTLNMVR